MKQYRFVNNVIGWVICLIACAVYIMTAEATASWWDCGEYIATANKLQVGHPPGAPTFQLIGRLFSMFSSPASAAHAVNVMSAVCSGFTILFLFWGITRLGKHLLPDPKNPDIKSPRTWAVFAAGIVGSLAYCFSDTFWFSAVEGEVYAMSSFFTALVFWAILKWEEQSDDPHSLRWLVLISLLVGVAIGVHLLNLLTVPALFYVVYFKKWPKTNWKGFILCGVLSMITLGIILWGIIPGIVNVDSAFDVFFVNGLGLPFNSGTIFFFVLLAAAVVFGLWYTQKKGRPVVNAALLSFAMLVIGYSTFFVLVIRANTNTPLNENCPKDAVSMRAYLGREQYGSTPLLTGQYYTYERQRIVNDAEYRMYGVPPAREKTVRHDTSYTKYIRGNVAGKDRYIPADYAIEQVFPDNHTGFFPRMWSADSSRWHEVFYEYWAGGVDGNQKPSFGQNMTYLHRYQMGWMYWRYFMWNFAGRQNDQQGHYFNIDGSRDYLHGNWICGINFIDEARLGPQTDLPDYMENDKSRNVYYLLPLLLGLLGLAYHVIKHPKDAFVVFIMFFMTGIAIAIYLNMPPRQPRERDYAFVGSFSFFAMWIGLGVMGLSEWISAIFKKGKEKAYKFVVPAVFVACMLGVPVLMACENWDDHDRSEKTAARDFAENYLSSMKKKGILITFGDNDTFPLWYAQEVEGIRTDVRILNYTLSGMYWYVEQLFNKLYDSDPLPFTLTKDFYGLGQDAVYLVPDQSGEYREVTEVLAELRDHPENYRLRDLYYRMGYQTDVAPTVYYIPTNRFKITLDIPALVAEGVIPAEIADQVEPEIRWEVRSAALLRHELMILDIIGTNKFHRDICIMNPGYIRSVYPLAESYAVREGMNFKLTPYYPAGRRFTDNSADYFVGGINGQPLKWGNLDREGIYVDPVSREQFVPNLHNTLMLLADDEVRKGHLDKARKLLEIYDKNFPDRNFEPDENSAFLLYANGTISINVIDIYKNVYGIERAKQQWQKVFNHFKKEIGYLIRFDDEKLPGVAQNLYEDCQNIRRLYAVAQETLEDQALMAEARKVLEQVNGRIRIDLNGTNDYNDDLMMMVNTNYSTYYNVIKPRPGQLSATMPSGNNNLYF